MAVEIRTERVQDEPSRGAMWRDPRVRSIAYQILTVVLFLLFVGFIVRNVVVNLERQGIASGFGFLGTTAGFDIGFTLIDYSAVSTYGRAFWVGLMNTILVAALGCLLATLVGFILGIARLSTNWLLARLATVYVETVRNIPLLLQLFFWYFAVLAALPHPRDSLAVGEAVFLNNRGLIIPRTIFESGSLAVLIAFLIGVTGAIVVARWARRRREETGQSFPTALTVLGLVLGLPLVVLLVTGVPLAFEFAEMGRFRLEGGLTLVPEFVALLAGLTIYTAAFIGEIVRAGILAISHGQVEAAHALGLKQSHTLRLVIIPQAMRVIIPPLTSQYLNLTKNSSLAVAIGYPDVVAIVAGTILNQTGQAVEAIAMTMAVYLTLSLLISLFMNWYNRRAALVER
ncbi:MAG TPA: amino acid ABC transporter permease [Geminicoccaceae bacterium]